MRFKISRDQTNISKKNETNRIHQNVTKCYKYSTSTPLYQLMQCR